MNKKIKIILGIVLLLIIVELSVFLKIQSRNIDIRDSVDINLNKMEESENKIDNEEIVAIFDNGAIIDYIAYGDDKNRYDLIYKKDEAKNIFWRGGSTGGYAYSDPELREEERCEQAFVKIDVLNNNTFLMQTKTKAGYDLEVFNIDEDNDIESVFKYFPFEEYKMCNNLIYGYGYDYGIWGDELHILVLNLDTYEVKYDEIRSDISESDIHEDLNILDNFLVENDKIYYKGDLIYSKDLAEADYCSSYRYGFFESAKLCSSPLHYFDYESKDDGVIGFCRYRNNFDNYNNILFIAKQGIDGVQKITEYFTRNISRDIHPVYQSKYELSDRNLYFIDAPFEYFKIEDFDDDVKKEIIFYSYDCGGANAGCVSIIHVFDFETEEFEYMARYINGGFDEAPEVRNYFSENMNNERKEYFVKLMDNWFNSKYGENWEMGDSY